MVILQGPLCKWTNMVKGWQYRWFVLDGKTGILSYFTSKDKMIRGSRRGCVRLKGAIVGIDDEDDSTFTITVDHKVFHFQCMNAEEREKWVTSLEEVITEHNSNRRKVETLKDSTFLSDFDAKISEADAYMQMMMEQTSVLEKKIDATEDELSRSQLNSIKLSSENMVESVKHAIVLLQIAKAQCLMSFTEPTVMHANTVADKKPSKSSKSEPVPVKDKSNGDENVKVPIQSYSSSDDENFYDAEDNADASKFSFKDPFIDADASEDKVFEPAVPMIVPVNDVIDELYDEGNEDNLDSLDQHGSVITHLLSQVRIGMDLTKITLPTFILERRSLLEMYSEFFAHPDIFVKISTYTTPYERMLQVVRWYLSSFHASRRSSVAKKPYNPILGEEFFCHWEIPDSEKPVLTKEKACEVNSGANNTGENDLPYKPPSNCLSYIAEQVSHHPPISAFYGEHVDNRIQLSGYIWTKSKFLGLSIGVHMIGEAVITVIDYDENYTITFPSGYGRSILTIPWVELGGDCTITCHESGYHATVKFHTKPFYGGKKDKVTANIYGPNDKKPLHVIQGEWNGEMLIKNGNETKESTFIDVKNMSIVKKQVRPRSEQRDMESRKLWENVTLNLKEKNIQKATHYKSALEQKQRDDAKYRLEHNIPWQTKYFKDDGQRWIFNWPLVTKLRQNKTV